MAYSTYLTNGSVFQSVAGLNVTVTLLGDDIYFNDAKILSQNVL